MAQTIQILGGRVQHEVDLARQQRGGAGGVLLDRREHHFGDVADLASLVPPVLVFLEHRAHVHFARLQLVGAGAVGVARAESLFLVDEVLRLGDVVLFRPGLVHDEHVGQLAQQHRVGRRGLDLDRQVVDLARFLDAGGVGLVVRRGRHGAVHGEHHVIRREGGAVMELHAGAQLEAVQGGRDLLPLGRQARHHLEVLVVVHQRFVDVAVGGDRHAFVLRMRIKGEDVALGGPTERFGLPDRGHGHSGGDRDGNQSAAHRCQLLTVV